MLCSNCVVSSVASGSWGATPRRRFASTGPRRDRSSTPDTPASPPAARYSSQLILSFEPHTPNPDPKTLNPKPQPPNPQPSTLNTQPETRNSKPENPKTETLDSKLQI